MVVKGRLEQRYVWSEVRAFSRVGRSVGGLLLAMVLRFVVYLYNRK